MDDTKYKMSMIKNLKKKYPEAEKLARKFLDSNCCDEDEKRGKIKLKSKIHKNFKL